MRKVVSILILFGFLLPNFSFAQEVIESPETLEEAKELGEEVLETTQKELPGIIERIWKEEVLPIWQKMYDWMKNFWDKYIWSTIGSFIKEEFEKRSPFMKEEFEKEKEEMKEDVPKVGKSLWEKFKDLIK